jgi:paraquat-inducible protein A
MNPSHPSANNGPSLIAAHRDWLVCHDCGALQALVPVNKSLELTCSHCGNPLHIGVAQWLDKATALAVTALILLISANIFTFLTLKLAGVEQGITILSGVAALAVREQWILASLVWITIFLLPLLEAFALLYLLIPYRLQRHLPGQIPVFRWLVIVQPWIMLDVFLLGVLVTTVKLGDKATVDIGPALPLFFALVCVLQMAYWAMDKNNLWSWLYSNNCFTRDHDETLYDCGVCKAMVGESIVDDTHHCPRCDARIHKRIPHSVQKTAALIIASIILYIPANLLSIMKYDELGTNYDSTIMSGVIDLARNGLWLVATVVFVASIIVPIAKLVMLSYLVWSVHTKMLRGARHRMTLYRVTEFIGRWSMVDVYVVTLLTAVVQFGLIGVVEPGAALLPFAGVVMLTMLAAETFDPRLIWDHADTDTQSPARERTISQLLAESTNTDTSFSNTPGTPQGAAPL